MFIMFVEVCRAKLIIAKDLPKTFGQKLINFVTFQSKTAVTEQLAKHMQKALVLE